ncbi:unnamed protein product [Paramecium sonneborni]|uniref:Uncharacterized protein n=1 Tax=Paramecium sonneborni TaxID=65129 RepID=A0A8S1RNF3_9CILI|nr:unnamed protein product [Paramecium sonneborni]
MQFTSHYRIEYNQDEGEVYQRKEELYEILASIEDIDDQIFKIVIEILRKNKISDIQWYFEKQDSQMFYESFTNKELNLEVRKQILKIANILRNIQDHSFSEYDIFTEAIEEQRQNLIKKIAGNKQIIEFLKFLVKLTCIDQKFIQCGSNGLSLLVQMKVDLTNQSFEDIRIKNASLIGANFVRCNFSRSEFENVDLRGVNLNEALLLNCKWKNIKIHKLNQLNGHTSGSRDKSICIWDVKTGQQQAKLNGHTSSVNSVYFSPDGTTLVSGSDDNSINLWDFKTRKQKAKLNGHFDSVNSVCLSPDGTTLASGSRDKSIYLWDVKTRKKKAKLNGHTGSVNSVCLSPDGTTLASGSVDKSIRLWDIKTGQQKANLGGHIDSVNSVCYSPDGTTLASGSWDKSIRLWNVKTGQQQVQLDGHAYSVESLCFSSDRNTLASNSSDKSICLWNVKIGQQKAQLNGHSSSVFSVCFSPNGTTLASGSRDNSIQLFIFRSISKMLNQLVILVLYCQSATRLMELLQLQVVWMNQFVYGILKQEKKKPNLMVIPIKFDKSASHQMELLQLQVAMISQSVYGMFRHDNKKPNQMLTQDQYASYQMELLQQVVMIMHSRNGAKTKSVYGDRILKSLMGLSNQHCLSLCFSPDGTTLASGSLDKSICLWDVQTGQQKAKLDGHMRSVNSVCFSPDGATLASGSDDNSIRLWDVKTGKMLQRNNRLIQNSTFQIESTSRKKFLFFFYLVMNYSKIIICFFMYQVLQFSKGNFQIIKVMI